MQSYYMVKHDSAYGHAGGVIDDIKAVLEWDTPIDSARQYFCYWRGLGRPFCDFIDPSGNPLIVSARLI